METAEGVCLLFLALTGLPDRDRRGLEALRKAGPARLVRLGPSDLRLEGLCRQAGLPPPEEGEPLPPDLPTAVLLDRLDALARRVGPGECLGLLAPPEAVSTAVAGVLGLEPGQRWRVEVPPGSLNRLDRLPDRWVAVFTGEVWHLEEGDG